MSGFMLGESSWTRVSCFPLAIWSAVRERRRRFPPTVERMVMFLTLPFSHLILTISNPPRAFSPVTSPYGHTSGMAGRRCTASSWLCTIISAIPAQHPKFPSIWNGGWASNMLAYVPPSASRIVAVGSLRFSWFSISLYAWLPSRSLAHRHTFHPMDHPLEASPRPRSDFLTAAVSSGVR